MMHYLSYYIIVYIIYPRFSGDVIELLEARTFMNLFLILNLRLGPVCVSNCYHALMLHILWQSMYVCI